MKSTRPKPLHLLAGRAMLQYMLDSLDDCDRHQVVVVVGPRRRAHHQEAAGHRARPAPHLRRAARPARNRWTPPAWGSPACPTTTAPRLTTTTCSCSRATCRCCDPGPSPPSSRSTVSSGAACTVLTARVPEPGTYGRVVRGKDTRWCGIVEQADATDDELAIDEINTAVYCFRVRPGAGAAAHLPRERSGEYYLTDVVAVLREAGYRVSAHPVDDAAEGEGINDRLQLAAAEAELRRRTNERWLEAGVTLVDPASTYLDATVQLGPDVTLFPGTILQGATVVGAGAEIGPHTRLVDCVVGAGAVVEQSNGRDAEIGADAKVGPFAALSPGASIPAGTVTGPFYAADGPEDG